MLLSDWDNTLRNNSCKQINFERSVIFFKHGCVHVRLAVCDGLFLQLNKSQSKDEARLL